MFTHKKGVGQGAIPVALSLCALTFIAPAFGQGANVGAPPAGTVDSGAASGSADARAKGAAAKKPKKGMPKVSTKKAISPNGVVNLVNVLVQQGVLKEGQGQVIIKQLEDESYIQRQAAKDASSKAEEAAKIAAAANAAANPPGTKHVTYVPEFVKRQMREEIKRDVMAQAQREGWASPGAYPEWASRIHIYGDMRARYEGAFFPQGNDPSGAINFNAINGGSPYQTFGNPYFWPTYDVNQDRNEFELRARFGIEADIVDGLKARIRVATGNDNSPVSTNQTLGGGSGYFSKYQAWLDRANLTYEHSFDLGGFGLPKGPIIPSGFGRTDLRLSIGRFDNPYWAPTDLVWYNDLAFDGVAGQVKHDFTDKVFGFANVGAFPIFNTAFNAGINLADPATGQPIDLPSHDKYLFGAQIGLGWKVTPEIAARAAVGYYDFTNVQGQFSSTCLVYSASDVCNTDLSRPSFAQKGNTYMALRNIPTFDSSGNQLAQYQYFGLASAFRPVIAAGQLDFTHFNPTHIILDGEFVWNSGFNRSYVSSVAVNNLAGTTDGSVGAYNGGDIGWLGRVTVGKPEIRHLWDWNVFAGYKYLQSDAVIDAFTDPDFGLGGTNLKGYFLGGNLGLADNVWTTLRWMSANNIAGSPYAVDVLQLDLNAKF